MITVEELKLNRFRAVRVPKNIEYFSRFGEYNPSSAAFAGEEDNTPIVQSKFDSIRTTDEDFKDFLNNPEQ